MDSIINTEINKINNIQQLYLYLMNLQVDKFDFKQKQRQMTKSPAYQKLASYFIPPVAIFFEYYILPHSVTHKV